MTARGGWDGFERRCERTKGLGLSARRQISGFVLAGVVGLIVDIGATTALTYAGAPPWLARPPAILLAMTTTFAINRRVAFAPSGRGLWAEFARYVGVSAAGAAINFLAYLVADAGLRRLGASATMAAPFAVAAGSLAGMVANFLGYRGFVFKPPRD